MNRIYFACALLLMPLLLGFSGCAPRALGAFEMSGADEKAESTLRALQMRVEKKRDFEANFDYALSLWFLKNDWRKALGYLQEAKRLGPEHTEAFFVSGLMHYFLGRVDEATKDFLYVLGTSPDGMYASIAAGFLYEFMPHTKDFPELATPVFESLIDKEKTNRQARLFITKMLEALYAEKRFIEKQDEMRARLGILTRFQLVAPFGTFGLMEFDKRFAPEEHGATKRQYQAGDADALETVVVDYERFNVRFSDLTDYGGVFYAIGYVQLKQTQAVGFRLESGHTSQLIVDDFPIMTIDRRNAYLPPVKECVVKLEKGWHRIVVKLGEKSPYLSFQLSLTKENGKPLAFEQFAALENQPPYQSSKPELLEGAPNAFDFWQDRFEKTPDSYNALLALLAAFDKREHEAFKATLEKAYRINDAFAPFYVLEAFQSSADEAIPNDIANEKARACYKKALLLDAGNALAAFEKAKIQLQQNKIEIAIQTLKRLEQLSPDYYLWPKSLFEIYNDRNWQPEALTAAKRALEKNPRSLGLLRELYYYYVAEGDFQQASEFLERIDRLDGDSEMLPRRLVRQGRLQAAKKAYHRLAGRKPYADGFQRTLADIALREGRYDDALAILDNLAGHPGQKRRYDKKRAEALLLADRKDEAMAIYRAYLQENPNDFSTRASLALLEGRSILGEHASDPMEIIERFKKERWREESGTVIVLDEYIMQLFADGSSLGRTHIIVRVQTKDALTRWGEVHLPSMAEVYQLRVIKSDGRILLPERFTSKGSVTMPDLDIGDFIEYDYVESGSALTRIRDGRLFSARFSFQSTNTPTYESNFVAIHDEAIPLHSMEMNYALERPEIKTRDGLKVIRYHNRKLEEISPEAFMPVQDEVIPMVHLSLPLSWRELRNLAYQELMTKTRPSVALHGFLKKHLPKGEAMSEREIVRTLFQAVVKEIEGESRGASFRQDAAHILHNQSGNRLVLLQALLKMKNIPSAFLFARPRNIEKIPYENASAKVYDDAVLEVRPQFGKPIYLQAAYPESAFDEFSPMLSGAEAMVLDNDAERLFTRLPVRLSIGKEKIVSLFVRLLEDGSAEMSALEEIDGYYAVNMRRELKRIPASQLKMAFEMILNENFNGAALKDVKVENLHEPTKPLRLRYRFHVRRLARKVGHRLQVEQGFFPLNLLSSYIRTASREYPLLINGVNSGYNQTVIKMPDGYAVEYAGQSKTIKEPFGVYRMNVERKEGLLKIERAFMIPIGRIGLEDYMAFYRFCSQVDQLEKDKLSFIQADLADNTRRQEAAEKLSAVSAEAQ